MSDPKNHGTAIGGLVANPEPKGDGKVMKFRLAIDRAGRDTVNPDNKSGYFDVVMFKDDDNPNAKFVFSQIAEGKMQKGSQVAIVYRLSHQRWQGDEGSRQAVELVAEAITYVGSAPAQTGAEAGEAAETPAQSASSGQVPGKF